jgi:hypothetical protein
VIAAYLASPGFLEQKSLSRAGCEQAPRYLERQWGECKRVASLSPEFIHKYQAKRDGAGIGGSRIARPMTYLNVALKYAQPVGFIRENPIAGVERVKDGARRKRMMSREEYEAIEKVKLRWKSLRGLPVGCAVQLDAF